MGKIINRADTAIYFGAALTTVDVWIKEGCPAKRAGKEWQLDSAEVHAWLMKRALAEKRHRGNRFGGGRDERQEGGDAPEGQITLDEAKRRKEVANAKSAELDLAKDMEAVAPIAMIGKVISDEIANARARLLAVPTKFRPTAQLHARDAERAKKLVSEVDALIHNALTEIKTYGTPEA